MNIAVFIDRDGTINEETGYIDSFDRFRILPNVNKAIRKLNQNNLPVIVVTNQSGVARGYLSMDFLDSLHKQMVKEFENNGVKIDGIYTCPHHPDEGCVCRKPKPGMLLKAAREKGITLHKSYVIGDKIIDIKLAHNVGAKGILVLTGYGAEELKSLNKSGTLSDETVDSTGILPDIYSNDDKPDHIASNLNEAVNWIMQQVRGSRQQVAEIPPTLSIPLKGGGKKRGGSSLSATNSPFPDTRNMRILIVKPSSLGDIIHSLPVLWYLRKTNPDACIGWVVKETWKGILERNPLLDDVIILKKGIGGFLSTVIDIRKMKYDTALDLQGLFRSGLLSILSGAKSRVGFSNAREFAHLFYNKKVDVQNEAMHAVDKYMLAIEPIARDYPTLTQRTLKIPLTPPLIKRGRGDLQVKPHFPLYTEIEDSEWVNEFLIQNNLFNKRPIIAFNPSARWVKKRWPALSYATLINRLIQELKAGIIILGSKEDIRISKEISSLVNGDNAIATGKTSIKMLTALLERVDLLITNDSGPMHIAAAIGTPVIALFGPTDHRLTGPYGDNHTVIKKNMECSPCLRKPCKHENPLCMESITVEEVFESVKTKLVYNKM